MEPAPVVATVNYQLQPVVTFTGNNWATFSAAFTNYARQQGFYGMLCEEGDNEPNEHVERFAAISFEQGCSDLCGSPKTL